jgi:hypothetical protein
MLLFSRNLEERRQMMRLEMYIDFSCHSMMTRNEHAAAPKIESLYAQAQSLALKTPIIP